MKKKKKKKYDQAYLYIFLNFFSFFLLYIALFQWQGPFPLTEMLAVYCKQVMFALAKSLQETLSMYQICFISITRKGRGNVKLLNFE